MTQDTDRRSFLKNSTTAVGATVAAQALGTAHIYAGEKTGPIRLGIIGCGGIMTHHVKGLVSRKSNVNISWLCDVDPAQINRMSKHVDGFQSGAPRQSGKYEEVLEDPDVDAVIIATPHHWHAPIALRAMANGKDVYVEKPISHVFDEGPLMIAAAKKFNRVVQQGSQMRSSPVTLKAEKLLKDGLIGEIKVARAWTAEPRSAVKPVPDSDVPAGVDYDRWLGPAPKRPFNKYRFHSTWRYFRDYANGEIGDDGIHDIDMACWGLGVTTLPKQVTARGSRMMLHGHVSDYPDNMLASYEYPDGRILIYENYPFTSYGLHGWDNGNVFYGTKGYMVFSRRGAFSVFLGPRSQRGPTEGLELRGQRGYGEHMDNFLTAVRNRTPTRASAEVAHRSCSVVHLGDIAQRTAGQLEFDPDAGRFVDSPEANKLLQKRYRAPFGLPQV